MQADIVKTAIKKLTTCKVILYDNPTIKKIQNNNALTFMSYFQVFREVHIEHNTELCTVKTNKSSSFKGSNLDRLKDKRQDRIDIHIF